MSDTIIRAEAERSANEVIRDQRITSLPIDPLAIAAAHDIQTTPMSSDTIGVSGFLMKQGDNFGIGYSTRLDNQGLINFTVSHELGHYFLPGHVRLLFGTGDTIHKSRSGFISSEQHERQADYFAANLLMPQNLFLPQLRRVRPGFAGIEELANLCNTSLTSTAIRFAALAEDPVAVVVSSGDRIDFCFMSEAFREIRGLTWLKKGSPVPAGTATERFNSNLENVSNCSRKEETTSFETWFDGPDHELCEDVVGLGVYGKTLTVLFCLDDFDEDQDDNDEEFERHWHRR